MDRPGVHQVPEGSREQGKMEEIGCKIICGSPTTFVVKGQMMMMMRENALVCVFWEITHIFRERSKTTALTMAQTV